MRELVLSDDLVLLSYIQALLKEAGLDLEVRDQGVSTMPGAIGAVPQRIVVADEDWEEARGILVDAGLEAWIVQ